MPPTFFPDLAFSVDSQSAGYYVPRRKGLQPILPVCSRHLPRTHQRHHQRARGLISGTHQYHTVHHRKWTIFQARRRPRLQLQPLCDVCRISGQHIQPPLFHSARPPRYWANIHGNRLTVAGLRCSYHPPDSVRYQEIRYELCRGR